jgi:hypothetical protein
MTYFRSAALRRAQTSTLRAAEAGRAADDTTHARQLANTARCLLELETEIGRSRPDRRGQRYRCSSRPGAVRTALGPRSARAMGRS